MIPLPTGLSLPNDAEVKPFSLTGMFILRGDKLMALELGGKTVPCDGEEEEDEEEEGVRKKRTDAAVHTSTAKCARTAPNKVVVSWLPSRKR